jgi:tRNA pseudouridine38-40 synthase
MKVIQVNRYKLRLEYFGFNYQGFQLQAHTDQTIQGQLHLALGKIFKSSLFKTIGSGRTDTGVHALDQWVLLQVDKLLDPEALTRALNSLLPNDIKVLACEMAANEWHPIFSATKKEYRYYFQSKKSQSAFSPNIISPAPHGLDLKLMQDVCACYIGEHNFLGFSTQGTPVKSTIREIYQCELYQVDDFITPWASLNEVYCFRVQGSGFLKQMVRLMVGTMWSIGLKKHSIDELRNYLITPTPRKMGVVAPPQGLYLHQVYY